MEVNVNLFKDKRFLMILLLLNLAGMFFSFRSYIKEIIRHITLEKFHIIPFFMVSFWLYLLAFIFVLYLLFDLKIPEFLSVLVFVYCFVYGVGSFVFFPFFMAFIKGLTLYHTWNIVAHGFVGLQSILFYKYIKKPKTYSIVLLAGMFLLKDFVDLFYGGFLYLVNYDFPFFLMIFFIVLILGLQILAFYLLIKKKPC